MKWRTAGLRGLNAVVVAVSGLVLATSCSGGGGDDETNSGPVTTRPPDKVLAEQANLQISDFPPEWKSTPVPPETVDAADAQGRIVTACLNRPPPEETRDAIAYSPDFSASETRRASSSVAVDKTVEIAQGAFVALKSDVAPGCYKASIDAEFRRQNPGEPAPETTIQRIDMPQFGDDTVAFRINLTTGDQGREVRTVIDEVFVRKGRLVLSTFFINRSAAFPADLQRTVLQRMVGRA